LCDTTPRAELLLDMSVTSPAEAREFARRSGCVDHAVALLDDALLLISELVTNSVRHGGAPIVLGIECDGAAIRVSVRDGSADLPRPRQASDLDENGRGLTLVEELTDRWGVERIDDEHGPGKAVWFDKPTQP